MSRYDTLVDTILNASNSAEGTLQRAVTLDLRDETHFQCVMELFGGEEHVRSEFPQLYSRAVKARQSQPLACKAGDGTVDREVVCDLAATEGQAIYSFGLTSLREAADEIYSTMNLYSNGKLVKRNFSFEFDCHRAEVDCLSDPIPGLCGEIRSELHVTWTPKGSDTLRSAVLESRVEYESVEDPVASAAFEHPAADNYTQLAPVPLNVPDPPSVVVRPSRRGPAQLSYINVCYDRAPENGESVNYAYGDTRIGTQQQRIFLDIRGRFSLAEKCTFCRINSISIGLDLGSGGSAIYRSLIDQSKNITIDQDKGEISFAFPTDWSVDIPSRKLAGREMSYLDAAIEFTYLDERPADPAEHKERAALVTASSAVSKNPSLSKTNHFVQLAPIKLNWGCVEAHTLVQMADGSEKMVSRIKIGDRVFSPEHRPELVTSIMRGVESELYAVRAVGGRTLLLTGEHPVYTAAGVKSAMELTPVDELILADGRRANIDALYTIQGDFQVYSLELMEGRCLICNGYQTGDLRLQGELMCGDHPAGDGPSLERREEAEKPARFFESRSL